MSSREDIPGPDHTAPSQISVSEGGMKWVARVPLACRYLANDTSGRTRERFSVLSRQTHGGWECRRVSVSSCYVHTSLERYADRPTENVGRAVATPARTAKRMTTTLTRVQIKTPPYDALRTSVVFPPSSGKHPYHHDVSLCGK